VTLAGRDITFACPGSFTVKGGQYIFDDSAGVAPALPPLPTQLAPVLSPEQMIRQAATHSLRFAFAGSDDVADLVGLVDAPYKIRDDTGATLAQGKVGKDGRLPRQDFPKGKELTLQVGEDAWKLVTAEPSSAPAAGAMEDDANALHVDDDPYFDAALDDASVHLDADILAYLIQHPEGEA
jgi:type VI secretion system secreted protein VgrG